jgi:hypothetical protein
MNKTVTERSFKFFNTYLDALLDEKFSLETIEFEGTTPPEQYDNKMSDNFRLKNFSRHNAGVSFIEQVYIKTK